MGYISAALYGLLQGITEFLPVSSSGHLAIAQRFFGAENIDTQYFTFNILLHLATLIAVFIVFWRDIFAIIPGFFTMLGKVFRGKVGKGMWKEYNSGERFAILIIIATIPLVPAILFKDYVEALSAYPKVIGGILIFNGIILLISDRIGRGGTNLSNAKPRNAIIVGLFQMCALVPGLSRSGSTITGGLTQGYDREFAVKFSFILSIPAILGANILQVPEMIKTPVASADILPYIFGMVVAAAAGVCAMKLLNFIAKKNNFSIFSYYCFAVGLLTVIFG